MNPIYSIILFFLQELVEERTKLKGIEENDNGQGNRSMVD
jgi:hypothetical protein